LSKYTGRDGRNKLRYANVLQDGRNKLRPYANVLQDTNDEVNVVGHHDE